uniref:Uncharacterized protein n=1 Tax=uncultured prokaryote TaxID=198431 RepID=A0A0H5Q5R2_9ZZZZ|nr:hypothetical protein [uncultured prokaryote]
MVLIYQTRTIFTGVDGAPYFNNLYFRDRAVEDPFIGAQAATVAFWTSISASMSNNCAIQVQPDITVLEDDTGEIQGSVAIPSAAFGGGQSGNKLPPATQLFANLKTGVYVGGRQIQGRIFVPALTVDSSNQGQPTASAVLGLQNACDTFEVGASPDVQLVVWRRPRPGTLLDPLPRAGLAADVNAAIASSKFAVLRSRRD